jgi:hypothetical protein
LKSGSLSLLETSGPVQGYYWGGQANWYVGDVGQKGRKGKLYRGLVERAKGSRQLGGNRRRWKSTNKMSLKESLWDGNDWINLDQDRDKWRVVMKTVIQGWIQQVLVNP